MPTQNEISFGQFRLDLTNECLWQGARSISLRPKAFAVLKLLIAHPGQLVNKQQVLEAVWPDTFVGDAVLKDNIRQLREALSDDASAPTYIETAHRRGYRFVGTLRSSTSVDLPPLEAAPRSVRMPDSIGSDSTARSAPLLGRESELDRLQSWLQQCLAGNRQVVFVTGEPGIGKTTLVDAFLQQALQVPGLRVARGQCLEHYGAGEAYLPFLDAFSRLCRMPEHENALAALRQHAPTWLVEMPSLLSPDERATLQSQTGHATRERMLREMAEAVEALASDAPLLLVLEDLHWSDYSTLDLISFLSRRRDGVRLMVLGTYRPVDVIIGEHPLKGIKRELQAHGLCRELPLNYLSEQAVDDYLSNRFVGHQFPARLRRIIHHRTEGNPLFMVNLIEYLLDQNVIRRSQDKWVLDLECSQLEKGIPANLRQLIEKQIERLTPDERLVLEGASVSGMECSSVAIAAGLDKPLDWVEQHCEQLAQKYQLLSPGWLVELPDGTVTPRRRFVHVLYLEVPYRLIPPMRRALIHQRIADRGVAIYGSRDGEIAAELAMHFEQSRDWPRALQYLIQAAQNASTRSAHHEAVDLANRGLQVLKLMPETGELAKKEMRLRMILSASIMPIKGFASPEVERINAPSRELFWRHGPSAELFYMLWSLNMYQQFSGNMETSLEISRQLLQLAEDLDDGALMLEAHNGMAAVLVLSGRYTEGLEHVEKGAALYSAHPAHYDKVFTGGFDKQVMLEGFAAMSLLPLGYLDQAAERIEAALALAEQIHHPETLVVAKHMAAQLHQARGEADKVQALANEALKLAHEYGFTLWVTYGLVELGWAEAELGNHDVGIEKMQRGLSEYESIGAKLRTPYFLGLLADQFCKAGRLEEGVAEITKALTLAEQTGEGYGLSELYRIEGELYFQISKQKHYARLATLSHARECFVRAVTTAKQQGTRYWELKAAISLHQLDSLTGHADGDQLASVYSSFNEGIEAPALRQAQSLLNVTLQTASAR